MSAPVNGSPAIPDELVAVVPELDPEVPPVEVVVPATPLLDGVGVTEVPTTFGGWHPM